VGHSEFSSLCPILSYTRKRVPFRAWVFIWNREATLGILFMIKAIGIVQLPNTRKKYGPDSPVLVSTLHAKHRHRAARGTQTKVTN
jgi:hypothetical protein